MSSRSFSRGRDAKDSEEKFGNNFPKILRYSSRVVDSFSTCLYSMDLVRWLALEENTKVTHLRDGRGSE